MIEAPDPLAETFVAHEHLTPDPAEVLARVNGIARAYQRRRWAVRATGGAVLGAGIIAGGIALPGRLGNSGRQVVKTTTLNPADSASATPTLSPTSAPSPSTAASAPAKVTYTQEQEFEAFFDAGYTSTDAASLAQAWQETDISTVKTEAGLKLLNGEALPIQPSGTPATTGEKDLQAYFDAGYGYDDAVALGETWHETDISKIKYQAGADLLAGKPLPLPPSGSTSGSTGPATSTSPSTSDDTFTATQSEDMAAFFAAGYVYDDAVSLGKSWHEADLSQVKIEAGAKLLAGATLPVAPSGTPESQSDKDMNEFFAAGYGYDQAVALGQVWNETDISQVKIEAGAKLLAGDTLPVAP